MSWPPILGTVPTGDGPGGTGLGVGVVPGGPAGRGVAVGRGFGVGVAVAVESGTTVGAKYGTVATGPTCDNLAELFPQPLTISTLMSMPQPSATAITDCFRMVFPVPPARGCPASNQHNAAPARWRMFSYPTRRRCICKDGAIFVPRWRRVLMAVRAVVGQIAALVAG